MDGGSFRFSESGPVPQLPNFFIIGAPKSGTTALGVYLGEHSDIFMCDPKEPQYFTFDLPGHRGVQTWEEYQALFPDQDRNVHAVGEASVWYLYSKVAIQEIATCRPDARLIVLLRRPDEMVVSLYAQQRQTGIETAPSFESAWKLEPIRRRGQSIPLGCRTPEFLYYRSVARYHEQLSRVFRVFPQEHVKVFLYEDLCKTPGRVYTEALEFLGVQPDNRQAFPVINSYADVYSPRLQSFLTWLLGHARAANGKVQGRLGFDLRRIRLHRPIVGTLQSINLNLAAQRAELPQALRQEIISTYESDILNLMNLLGCDLTHWLH